MWDNEFILLLINWSLGVNEDFHVGTSFIFNPHRPGYCAEVSWNVVFGKQVTLAYLTRDVEINVVEYFPTVDQGIQYLEEEHYLSIIFLRTTRLGRCKRS
ncbi:hypothetical protein J6590_043448 [Homalodisca vitripennis]|nr:hypothetical protein J6590_043448 [Homalodisca vitripennis]